MGFNVSYLVNKLLNVQIKGTDVTLPAQIKGSDVNLPVQLTGSNAIKGAVQNVAAAGTRLQLPNFPCREVTIIAKRGNTGSIYVGGSDVSLGIYGAELQGNDSITLAVNNTNLIYIDASVSGEGISYVSI